MKKPKHELIIILTLSLLFILLLFLAQRYPNTYRNNLGFLEIVLNFINFCLLPFTLFFTGKNYFNQRNQKRLDAENIDLTLRLRNDDTTPAYHIAIPRYLCSRQEIKGILSDRCRGNYNIPSLSEPAFLDAIVAARSGDSNQLTIYIDARDELGIDGALRGDYYVSFQIKGEQKPKQTFVDVSGKEYGSEEALRNAQKARYNQMTVELEEWEKSIASRNKFLSMGRSFVFLGMLAGALLVAFFAGKPFYDSYQAKKQAEAAYGELVKAGKSVMDYIRAEQAFPSTMPYYERDGNYYDINVKANEKLQGSSIELSFNNEAYDGLQNGSLTFELYQIPNGILDWRCHAQIPGQFAPVRCMVN